MNNKMPPKKKQKTEHRLDAFSRTNKDVFAKAGDHSYPYGQWWMLENEQEPLMQEHWHNCIQALGPTLPVQGDKGFAELYSFQLEPNNLKVVDSTFNGYCWNKRTKLWEARTFAQILCEVSRRLTTVFQNTLMWTHEQYDNIPKCGNPDYCDNNCTICGNKERMKELIASIESVRTCLKKVSNYQSMSGVAKYVCVHFLNSNTPDFEEIVNMSSTELPVKGGQVIDFKTLNVREREHSDYWSYELDVQYKPALQLQLMYCHQEKATIEKKKHAAASVIQNFYLNFHRRFVRSMLMNFCNNDVELLNYLQRIFGVMCTREAIQLKKIIVFIGTTDKGKSEIFKWINETNVLQQNFVPINPSVLLESGKVQKGRCTTEMMRMPGARVCVCSELEEKDVWNSKMVKRLTGGDPNAIRGLYSKERTFVNRSLTVIHTNHAPKLKKIEQSMINRIENVPCIGKIVKNSENNKKCKRMLLPGNQSALFSWMAEGARLFLKDGCSLGDRPQVVKTENEEYFKKQDTVTAWISTMCTTGKKIDDDIPLSKDTTKNMKHMTLQSNLYEPYGRWCQDEGKVEMTKSNFLKQMKAIQSKHDFLFKKSGALKVFGLRIDEGIVYETSA